MPRYSLYYAMVGAGWWCGWRWRFLVAVVGGAVGGSRLAVTVIGDGSNGGKIKGISEKLFTK
jgi:hypothetical protein